MNSSSPKVAVDARMVGMGGIGRYTSSLVRAMMKLRPRIRWILVGRPEMLKGFDGAELRECRAPIYSLGEALGVARAFYGADLVHVPHFNAPFGIRSKLVVTIHDLIHFDHPEYQPFPGANALLDWRLRRLLKKADGVISVSEATASALKRRYPGAGLDSKLRVTWEAADDIFDAAPSPDDQEIVSKRGIPEPYFLYVGAIRQHKETNTLLEAFIRFKGRYPGPARLVLAGHLDQRFEKKHHFLKIAGSRPDITWFSDAGDRELPALYRRATAVVMPSRVEGFGLPVLEAMRSGVPVIISDASALTEIAGPAALVFGTGQIDPLCDHLYNVLNHADLAASLRIKGICRASEFAWSKTAALTLGSYDAILR